MTAGSPSLTRCFDGPLLGYYHPQWLVLSLRRLSESVVVRKIWKSDRERFEDKFIPEPNSGCWLWMARVDRAGYGGFRYMGDWQRSHRVSYKMYRGPIPDGMLVCHRCDTPGCVNPDHLFLGTAQDNIRDRDIKGRGKVPGLRGPAHGQAKLTEGDVVAIRADERTHREIAADYNVGTAQVGRIKRRKQWVHI